MVDIGGNCMLASTRLLTVMSFLSMFFLGVGITIVGAAARNIGLTPFQIGLLISIQNIGFLLSVTISGSLADTFDKPRILFIGSFILAVSFFCFYLRQSFYLNLFIMFFIGAGIGTYEGVTDPMLLDLHEGKESLFININHFFVTFGCLMITLYLVFLQMNWRQSMIKSGIVVLCLAFIFGLTRIKGTQKTSEGFYERFRFLKRQKIVLVFYFATVCAIGLETCIIGIMTTFLMELRGLTQVTSKIGLIIFLSGIGLGRLCAGFVARREKILDLIILLFGLATLFLTGLFLIKSTSLTYALVLLSGLTVSALFPLLIAFAGILYKSMAGTVLGIIKLALPSGGILIPLALSVISRYSSFEISLFLFPLIALAGFLAVLLSRRALNAHYAELV